MNKNKPENTGKGWSLVLYGITAVAFGLITWVYYQTRLANRPAAGPQTELTVELKSDKATVSAGEEFTVSVYISGAEAENLSAAQLDLNYDNDAVKLVNYGGGEFWKQGKLLSAKTDANGINLAIGKEPGGNVNLEQPVASFKFRLAPEWKNPLQFWLSSDTQFAKLGGGDQPVPYQTAPLMISVN